MEIITLAIVILVAIGGLIALDLLALGYGVDSRGSVGDDHAWHIGR